MDLGQRRSPAGSSKFDPSLVILATVASVEAIFISTFVLISQNLMAEAEDKRSDLNLQISLLAEHEATELQSSRRPLTSPGSR